MTDHTTQGTAGLIERLKAEFDAASLACHVRYEGGISYVAEARLRDTLKDALAFVSAKPAPVEAMSHAEIAARKECETLEWRQEMVNPTQVIALLQQFQFIERELDVPKPLIAAARYALEYFRNRVQQLRKQLEAPPAPVQEGMVMVSRQDREYELNLLKAARCPDPNCDNSGTTFSVHRDRRGDPEQEPEQCEWCWRRQESLAALERLRGE